MPRISVVINTFNRGDSLRRTLEALTLLDYAAFEVVVVNGPSTDTTESVLAGWQGRIKRLDTGERNLSVSRNIGIAAAAGEIVAFIDDDAYPDPAWLDRLAAAYADPEVGGAGGPTYDHTGYTLQVFQNVSNRFGATWSGWPAESEPSFLLSLPNSNAYPSMLGANSSFRRDRLVEIGGFDEEFDYYLDETDVCLRIVDRGWVLRTLPDAFVYHKFLPSQVRDHLRVLRERYAVIKNRLYFALKHAPAVSSFYEIVQDALAFVEGHRRDCLANVEQGKLGEADRRKFEEDVRRAFDTALARYAEGVERTRPAAWFAARQTPFLPFATRSAPRPKLHLCFMSREYPPGPVGGIARFTREVAVGLAELGHQIHVLTRGEDHHRVDLEDGVWVHRIVPSHHDTPAGPTVPQVVWDYSASLTEELRRIHRYRPVDLVEAPLWDSEGIAAILDGTIPVVVSLHTPLPTALAFSPHWTADRRHAESYIKPLLVLEPFCLTRCAAVLANSRAVVEEIERGHGIGLDQGKLGIVPHGIGVPAPPAPPRDPGGGGGEDGDEERGEKGIEVLFVGRLEGRKGIDLLLAAIPDLRAAVPALRFTIVGDDPLATGAARSHRQAFEAGHRELVRSGAVRFTGAVGEEELDRHYAGCDIFVAPSRYESFGLVLLEAMRHGRPVIACDIGGMREVIAPEETGLLVPPDDAGALGEAIERLARDPGLRDAIGGRARAAYEHTYTRAACAERSVAFYRDALRRLGKNKPRTPERRPLVGHPA